MIAAVVVERLEGSWAVPLSWNTSLLRASGEVKSQPEWRSLL